MFESDHKSPGRDVSSYTQHARGCTDNKYRCKEIKIIDIIVFRTMQRIDWTDVSTFFSEASTTMRHGMVPTFPLCTPACSHTYVRKIRSKACILFPKKHPPKKMAMRRRGSQKQLLPCQWVALARFATNMTSFFSNVNSPSSAAV